MQGDILVVDDVLENLRLLMILLQEEGYEVRVASSVALARREISTKIPDLILLDINMPEVDGHAFCQELKADDVLAKIPVVFLSAMHEVKSKVKGFKVGGIDYITKPFEVEEVLTRVDHHLQHQRLKKRLQKKNKQLAQRNLYFKTNNRNLRAFNHIFAEDLIEPLNRVQMTADLLKSDYQDLLDTDGKQYFEVIDDSLQHLTQTVNYLLEFTNSEQFPLEIDVVPLDAIAHSIIEKFQRRNPQHQVDWQIQPQCEAIGNPNTLAIALFHLLENAWKYTQNVPNPCIEFGMYQESKSGLTSTPASLAENTVYFVRDNGIGFKMTQTKQLFIPFKTLHSQVESSGRGMGLAITQNIIHRHGGLIWTKSQPHQGATFFFTLNPEI